MPSTLVQSKERKESNFAIWQPWLQVLPSLVHFEHGIPSSVYRDGWTKRLDPRLRYPTSWPQEQVYATYGPSYCQFLHSGELRNDDAILAWITKELQAVDIPEVKPRFGRLAKSEIKPLLLKSGLECMKNAEVDRMKFAWALIEKRKSYYFLLMAKL